MNGKSWHHVSPVTGLGLCSAQSPEACKFGANNHFNAKAVARIEAERPANFNEHEAMRKNQEIAGKKVSPPWDTTPLVKPTPKPVPMARPVPVAPQARASNFPTSHRRPQKGDETLYHKEIGFPRNFKAPAGVLGLKYTRHAEQAALDDRYGEIIKPARLTTANYDIVELGVQDNRVSKIVYRGPARCTECHYSQTAPADCTHEKKDIILVVMPPQGAGTSEWVVKTVWTNLNSDKHRTLDESKYAKPVSV